MAEDDSDKTGAKQSVEKSSPEDSICSPEKLCPYFYVEVNVLTRAGEIPIKGVKTEVDLKPLGFSNDEGVYKIDDKIHRVRINKSSFIIKATYQNTDEKLKLEILEFRLTNVDHNSRKHEGEVVNKIEKIQDVAGAADIDFDNHGGYKVSEKPDELSWENTDDGPTLKVTIKMATLSLYVPYINQRLQNDTVNTIAGKDPDPAPHEVKGEKKGKFGGNTLCYPTSVAMVLSYWLPKKEWPSRQEVTQRFYNIWADAGFPERLDKKSDTIISETEPASPPEGKYWLDTSLLKGGGRSLMKLAQYKTLGKLEWTKYPEFKWRVIFGRKKIWEFPKWAVRVLESWMPTGTSATRNPLPKKEKFLPLTEVTQKDNDIEQNAKPKRAELNAHHPKFYRETIEKGWPFIVSTSATPGHMMVVRGVVVDKNLKVEWLIINDPYGNLASSGSIYEPLDIAGSVGKGGKNYKADVAAVQESLRALGLYSGDINGECDDKTVQAIKTFKRKELKIKHPKGLITPNSRAEKRRMRLSAGYKGDKVEVNAEGSSDGNGALGKHVYYWNNTHGMNNILRIKGGGRGFPRIEKNMDKSEIAAKRLTPGN